MDDELKELLKRIQKPNEFMSLADRQKLVDFVYDYELQYQIHHLIKPLDKEDK